MSAPSVEEFVAECELTLRAAGPYDDDAYLEWVKAGELRALIASWRERGDALRECADGLEEYVEAHYAKTKPHLQRQYDRDIDPVRRARAALKDKP